MTTKLELLLEKILLELKELNHRVNTRANNTNTISFNTAKTTRIPYQMTDIIGIKANHIAVLDVGGGFSIAINSEKEITASNDYVIENEEISSITVIGSGTAGTATIRVSGYVPKYKTG